ncbi:MAG: hypothetical protein PHE17_18385 [Thiothrix sp.]|uniref:hypothetical protein n=1 Tax=Thiothrix sp. TaxID=1032 RepID=UPI00262919A7|nr:hypothetical protein [Thiothrix sp.]MDD5394991.1 hypothetical protein [Thiothrix sp.]
MKQQIMATLLLASLALAGCSGTGTVIPGKTQHVNQSFEDFADSYASPGDVGDGIVYKFSGFDKILGATYHVSVRKSRFWTWCIADGYKFTDRGDLALGTRLRKLYPGETITDATVCGDGKGGFYGYAYFNTKHKTAFMKAGVLNPKVIVDFWPGEGKQRDFWEKGKEPLDMWPEAAKK